MRREKKTLVSAAASAALLVGVAAALVPTAAQALPAADVVPVEPFRLATLTGMGSTSPSLQCVSVAGAHGIPEWASGVFLNVTAAEAAGPGNAVVYPDTAGTGATAPPASSTVNFEAGRDVANNTVVALPENGDVCVKVNASPVGRLILDVTGYLVGDAGVGFFSPERLLDSRDPAQTPSTVWAKLSPFELNELGVAQESSVPEGAIAAFANVTVTGSEGPGNLRVFSTSEDVPDGAAVNFAKGHDKSNGQLLLLGDETYYPYAAAYPGRIALMADGARTHAIIDVSGYVMPDSPLVPTPRTRIVETRAAYGRLGLAGRLEPYQAKPVTVPESVVPAGATAVLLNVVAIQPSGIGHLRVFPYAGAGAAVPDVSSINFIAGRDIPNMVMVPLGATREVGFYGVASSADLAVDVVGYILGDS